MSRESLKNKILELHEQGKTNAEISQIVGCTRANVTMTLKRSQYWSGNIVRALPPDVNDWLVRKAAELGMKPGEFAYKILTDKIKERMASNV